MIALLSLACTFVSDAEWDKRLNAECEGLAGYVDADGDGYGGPEVSGCDAVGATAVSGDCNDGDASIHPGATEVFYDGIDQDCDEDPGEDQDGDGWPRGSDCMDSVDDPLPGYTDDCAGITGTMDPADIHPGAPDTPYDGIDADCSGATDFDFDQDGWRKCDECDDEYSAVNPDATEIWHDGVDQDCDGNDDDQDFDGYPLGVDCDDRDAAIHPDAVEVFHDGIDQNCDPSDDEDADADGYDSGIDCDDGDPAVNPKATEIWYDGIDQDCDGNDDDQDVDGSGRAVDCADTDASVHPGAAETWYDGVDQDCDGNDSDQDKDGAPLGEDCDDERASVYPGASEIWYDGIDQDCDGNDDDQDGDGFALEVDCDDVLASVNPDGYEDCATPWDDDCDGHVDLENAANCVPWFEDDDRDGFGGPSTSCWCDVDVGRTDNADDCDDADEAVRPSATEDCATVYDDNCDADTNDVDALGCVAFHADADADGLGAASDICRCEIAPDLTTDARDCDDSDADVGLAPSWFVDADGDGLGDDDTFVTACTLPVGAATVGGDCDDSRASVLGPTPWFADADGDGFGNDITGFIACTASGAVSVGGDCDDGVSTVNPGVTEDCSTSADDDCSGTDNDEGALGGACWFTDRDRDGYGADGCHVLCRAAGVTDATVDGDCDDASGSVYPGAAEVCENFVDEDCSPDSCALDGVAPVVGANAVLLGPSGLDLAGRAVAGGPAGLLVGGLGGGTGRAWMWSAGLGGSASLSGASWAIQGVAPYDGLGDAVGFGDEAGDLALVAGSHSSAWQPDGGVVLGFASSLSGELVATDADVEIGATAAGQSVGAALSVAGDPTDDAVSNPRFAVGAPGYDGVGAVAAFTAAGGGVLLFDAGDQLVVGTEPGGDFGAALAGGQDLDGDGLDDLVVGAPRAASGQGAVYIVDDPAITSVDDVTRVILGGGGSFGQAVAIGAFDGSGAFGVAVGAPDAGGGAVWLLPGDALDTSAALATFADPDAADALGRSIAVADTDSDGTDDLLFGIQADGWSGTDGGAVVMFRGPHSGARLTSAPDALRYGMNTADKVGSVVGSLPDWDGDGFPEWLVGAPGEDILASEAGSVRVLFGSGD